MAELLTESFCERCGTRYTFESSAPSGSPLGRVRTLGKGLRNFVLHDRLSLSEALADARHAEEISATTTQLDAFHRTFSFCIECRQYTCGACWNVDEGRCRSCAPLAEDTLEAAAEAAIVPDYAAAGDAPVASAGGEAGAPRVEAVAGSAALPVAPPSVAAWPSVDLVGAAPVPAAPTSPDAAAAEAWPAQDLGETPAEGAPVAAVVTEEVSAAAEAAAAAVPARPRLVGMEPGQSLEDAIAQAEARLAAQEHAGLADRVPAVEPEPLAKPELAAEPLAEPEPEADLLPVTEPVTEPVEAPSVAEQVAELEPVADIAPAIQAEPVTAPGPAAEPIAAAQAKPAIAAAAPAPDPGPAWLTVAPSDPTPPPAPSAPQWPTTPVWGRTAASATPGSTLAGRPLVEREDVAAVWAASAREVLTGAARPTGPTAAPAPTATPHPCVQCGLSLSANARFCRRCGSRQG